MKKYIECLASTELDNYQMQDSEHLELSRFNIFIGANNSGKSRLLRMLFNKNDKEINRDIPFSAIDAAPSFFALIESWPNLDLLGIGAGQFTPVTSTELLSLLKPSEPQSYSIATGRLESLQQILTALQDKPNILSIREDLRVQRDKFLTVLNEKALLDEKRTVEELLGMANQYKLKRIYIPMLRGLRPIPDSPADFYKNRTVKDYFSEGNDKLKLKTTDLHRLVTGLGFYEELKQHLLGQPNKRKRIVDYQKLLAEEFFDGKEVTLIPEHDLDVVSVMIGDKEQRPIYALGDGLQQIIIITFAAFMSEEPSLIFIEEPEINLHPGLQRRLAEFLLTRTEHQYYITTHSNHFLDLADVRDGVKIYKVSEKSGDTAGFELKACDTDRSLLHELGVKPSSVYLANSTIWVEGITDRLYLQAYLKQYLKELDEKHPDKKIFQSYKENFHYAFVEYQGGNLVHWDFESDEVNPVDPKLHAVKVAAHGIVIADSDIKDKADREQWLLDQLGDRVVFTSGKEIDNMLPLSILKATVKEVFNSKNSSPLKTKTDISLIDSLNESYQNSGEGIGLLIDTHLKVDNPKNSGLFSAESGTIKNKVKFCECAIRHMKKDDWLLTADLKLMCERIFQHIKSCNI